MNEGKIMKEPFALTKTVDFGSCVPVETLRACALIGLHMMAAGGASLSNSAFLVIYEICGDMVAEKSPDWNSDVDDWTESEGLSSFEERGHNVESLARELIGQNGSGEMVSLYLEDWELAQVALSCHVALEENARSEPWEPALPSWKGCNSMERAVMGDTVCSVFLNILCPFGMIGVPSSHSCAFCSLYVCQKIGRVKRSSLSLAVSAWEGSADTSFWPT